MMIILILGIVLFLGVHSARIFAEPARQQFIAKRGVNAWKGLYTVVSLVGFALIIWGYSLARQSPTVLWTPPLATRHIAALLNWLAFILVLAPYAKNNFFKTNLRHPMTLGVKVWALAHLISNGHLADIILFGSFLLWAVLCFSAARKRDRAEHISYPAAQASATVLAVVIGTIAWAVMAFWLHGALIGVKPFG